MFEIWIIFAILAAIAQAANPLINEYFKVGSLHLLFWLRLFVGISLLPILFILPPPTDPIFYLSVAGAIACFSYFDLVYFKQAAESGAGMITRFEGLVVAITFVVWLLVDPALFVAGLGIVFGKTAMVHSDYHNGVWYYLLGQCLMALVIYGAVLKVPALAGQFKLEGKTLWDRRVMLAALVMSVSWIIHAITKYYAITEVENPAYVTIIGLTAPFMVVGFYALIGRREQTDVWSGLGLVICAILLVCFAHL